MRENVVIVCLLLLFVCCYCLIVVIVCLLLLFRNMLINMMSNAVFKQLMNQPGGGEPLITTYIMPIPLNTPQNITIDIASILGGILYPFAYSFLIPVRLQKGVWLEM